MAARENQKYLEIELGKESYGIDIGRITSINEANLEITRVPKAPRYIKGVINLRGEIIPVMDLSMRLKMPEMVLTGNSRIIIVKADDIKMGLLVDGVNEIVTIDDSLLKTDTSEGAGDDFILGVGKVSDGVITVLNVEKILEQDY